MEKKSKKSVIVGVSSLILITLILLGLTYAYYRTRIIGNKSEDPSISVISRVLEITYSDKTPVVNMTGLIEPNFEYSKEFTIENTGEDTVNYSVNFVDVVNTFQNYGDVVLELTCESNNGTCNGLSRIDYPLNNIMFVTNAIGVDEIQTYKLYVKYLETNSDQSSDMGRTISGRIDIKDVSELNPYYANQESLAYNILNNSLLAKNGTYFNETTSSDVGVNISKTIYRNVEREITEWTLPALGEYWLVSTVETENDVRAAVNTWATTGDASALLPYLTQNCDDTIGKEIVIAKSITDYNYYTISSCYMGVPIYEENTSEILGYESALNVSEDDDGKSYYYRGNVEDNYVDFAGMCWRVVRINGDDSIRLILEDQDNTCSASNGNWDYENIHYGYKTNNSSLIDIALLDATDSSSFAASLQKFQQNKLASKTDSLVSGNWCYANNVYDDRNGTNLLSSSQLNSYLSSYTNVYFDSYTRLFKDGSVKEVPTLKCNGTELTQYSDGTSMYVGGITADEMVFAGATLFEDSNPNFYMVNDYQKTNQRSFLTITPAMYTCENSSCTGKVIDFRYCTGSESSDPDVGYCTGELKGNLSQLPSNWKPRYLHTRPVINLKKDITIVSGNGTKTSPYVVG